MENLSNAFVVCMGIGTVFLGLILIIIMCKIVSLFCRITVKSEAESKSPAVNNEVSGQIENRQEIIAAVTAACAEDMGKDVSALRVVSFKKL